MTETPQRPPSATVSFAFLKHMRAPEHAPVACTWAELHDFLKAYAGQPESDKSNLRAVSFAEYSTTLDHKKPACLQVCALALDLDGVKVGKNTRPYTDQELQGLLTYFSPFEYVLYTSFSSTSQHLKIRLIVRLDKPIPAGDWRAAFETIRLETGNLIDAQCKNPNRFFYVPCNDSKVIHHPGEQYPSSHLLRGAQATPGTIKPDLPDSRPIATKADLQRVARKLKATKHTLPRHFGAVLQNVLDGVPYADQGSRDEVTFRLAYFVAEQLPDSDPISIAQYFGPSLDLMGSDAPTVENVAEKVARQQNNVREQLDAAKVSQDEAQKRNLWSAFAFEDEDRDWPYVDQELSNLSDSLKTNRAGLKRQWIIQKMKTFWVLSPRGYLPFGQEEVSNAARVHLAPAITDDVNLFAMHNNSIELKTPRQLVRDYGSVATKIHTHLDIVASRYDERTGIFHEAATPLRDDLVPLEHTSTDFRQIDEWIRTLGKHNTKKLKQWIFWVTELSKPCVALFLTGEPGSGKNMLVCGLAKLWGSIPTALSEVIGGNFNEALLNCPLTFADEELPKDFRGNVRTEALREIIQGSSRQLKRKNIPTTTMQGAIRLVIAGNNEELLQFKGMLTDNDLRAISERILHIDAQPEAERFLSKIYPGEGPRHWVDRDLIARYALTLQEIHRNEFKPECRFLIKTTGDMVYRTLAHGGARFDVLQWLICMLLKPELLMSQQDVHQYLYIGRGQVIVHRTIIERTWDSYCRREAMPPSNRISNELRNMGKRTKIPYSTTNGYAIYHGHLRAWLAREGTCDFEKIQGILNKGVDLGPATTRTEVQQQLMN